jgi:hypothetical protein
VLVVFDGAPSYELVKPYLNFTSQSNTVGNFIITSQVG